MGKQFLPPLPSAILDCIELHGDHVRGPIFSGDFVNVTRVLAQYRTGVIAKANIFKILPVTILNCIEFCGVMCGSLFSRVLAEGDPVGIWNRFFIALLLHGNIFDVLPM